jgi:DNA-binding transcriptional LysR family regulator
MRADDLLILLEVARCGSLVGAGAALGLGHTTVSRRITALERDLHVQLVIRSASGCQLTDAGQALLAASERIEASVTEAFELARCPTREPSLAGLVRVAAPEGFAACFVAPVLGRMHARHPGIIVELVTASRLSAHGSGSDIEIGVGEPLSRRPDASHLCDYELGLYASVDYITARGEPRTLEEFTEHSAIFFIDALLQIEDENLALASKLLPARQLHIASTSIHSQISATVAGGGIGLFPSFLADPQPKLRRLLVRQATIRAQFLVGLAPRHLLRPAAISVMKELRAEIAARQHDLTPTANLHKT